MRNYTKNQKIAVAVGVVFIVVTIFFGSAIFNLFSDDVESVQGDDLINVSNDENMEEKIAKNGSVVSVHYTGTLEDGTKFDSSYDRGEPIEFTLGAGMVIAGWEQEIEGMKVGDKKTFDVPPHLGYGDRQVGPIPPNSTLTFEVELVNVTDPK